MSNQILLTVFMGCNFVFDEDSKTHTFHLNQFSRARTNKALRLIDNKNISIIQDSIEESFLPNNAICLAQLKGCVLHAFSPQMRADYNLDINFSKHLLEVTDIQIDVAGSKAKGGKWESKAVEIRSDASFTAGPLSIVLFRKDNLISNLNSKGGNCLDMDFVKKQTIRTLVGHEYQKLLLKKPLSDFFKSK